MFSLVLCSLFVPFSADARTKLSVSLDSGVGKLKRENHLSRPGDGAGELRGHGWARTEPPSALQMPAALVWASSPSDSTRARPRRILPTLAQNSDVRRSFHRSAPPQLAIWAIGKSNIFAPARRALLRAASSGHFRSSPNEKHSFYVFHRQENLRL